MELSFAPDEDQQQVVMLIVNDDVQEPIETFTGRITLPPGTQSGVQLGQDRVTIQVLNDDSK